MADETDKSAKAARDDRLKSALRENLKRRKVQARERAAGVGASESDDGSPDGETAGKSGG